MLKDLTRPLNCVMELVLLPDSSEDAFFHVSS